MSGLERRLWLTAILSPVLVLTTRAHAQCLDWTSGFALPGGGTQGVVRALTMFDDGHGPALYVGGSFLSAGGVPTARVAKWDGVAWSPLAEGIQGESDDVYALAVFDDGNGPALFAGGNFEIGAGAPGDAIAKWDGSTWSPVGSGMGGAFPAVYALAVFDDGQGPALYAAGSFATAGGVPASNVARWDGTSWSPVGGGCDDAVLALTTFDGGSGAALYAGGYFTSAGGTLARRIAKWDGASWSSLGGSGVNGHPSHQSVRALAVFDDGSGPALYVGGNFTSAGGVAANHIARWDGSSWSQLDAFGFFQSPPFPGQQGIPFVHALAVYDDGSGPALYATGKFTHAGCGGCVVGNIARWDGVGWSGVGPLNNPGLALSVGDVGSGPVLFAGGTFGAPGSSVAQWNGAWSSLGGGQGTSSPVHDLTVFDDGSGPALYAGGSFYYMGTATTPRIARWDGTTWSALGSGGANHNVNVMHVHDDGSGPALFVGGVFDTVFASGSGIINANYIAKWDGTSWYALGSGVSGGLEHVSALATFDDGSGPALYAGGRFSSAGGVPANNVAKWDGASWSPLGAGLNDECHALAVFDDGSGPVLYATGYFTNAGGSPAMRIAKWDGSSWSPLGTGLTGSGNNGGPMLVFDDGSGPGLYVGGTFSAAGGVPASCLAKWNGASWSAVGAGIGSVDLPDLAVYRLAAFDDGSGPALYVTGNFLEAGGVPTSHIAKWNGSTFAPLGNGLGGNATTPQVLGIALAVFDDGSDGAPDLYVGGEFATSGGISADRIARWRGCGGPGELFCAGDGGFYDCPCNNLGLMGHGCDNSAATGGALLVASGTTSPDTLVLQSSGELSSVLSVFLQGDVEIGAVSFGDGLRCTGGTLKRLYAHTAAGGAVSAPTPGELSITARSAELGDPIAPGSTRYYQVYYRDPDPAFCPSPPGDAWNATNGLRVGW